MNRNSELLDLSQSVCERLKQTKLDIKPLANGCIFWKIRSGGKWYSRRFWLDINSLCLRYDPSQKPFWASSITYIDLTAITQVREWKSSLFQEVSTHPKKRRPTPVMEQCITIVFKGGEYNLVALDSTTATIWLNGLNKMLTLLRAVFNENIYRMWLREQFLKADVDKSGELDFKESRKLLKQMNIKMSKCYAVKLFETANVDKELKHGKQVLNVDEFVRYVSFLTKRADLEEIFKKYAIENETAMTVKELQEFLSIEQQVQLSENKIKEIITTYEVSTAKQTGHITLSGFSSMMTSDMFNVMKEEHRKVHQDMTQPLNRYYIASSHNTYLTGNQLTSKSSVGAYIDALENGCRCVELDLWDGSNNQPLIYHGYTMTTDITVRDVLTDAIKPYAFKTTPYPLILSLENHLSSKQQKVLAALFKEILGDMLYTTPVSEDMGHLPSPEELKYKVILKCKKTSDSGSDGSGFSSVSNPRGSNEDLNEETNLQESELSVLISRNSAVPLDIEKERNVLEVESVNPSEKDPHNPSTGQSMIADIDANIPPPIVGEPPKEKPVVDFEIIRVVEEPILNAADAVPAKHWDQLLDLIDPEVEQNNKEPASKDEPSDSEGKNADETSEPTNEPIGCHKSLMEPTVETETINKTEPFVPYPLVPNSASLIGDGEAEENHSNEPITKADSNNSDETDESNESLNLSDLINICQAKTFRSFQRSIRKGQCYHMSSLSESKAEKLIEEHPLSMIELTNRQLIRIYPKASRTDSSNYNPMHFWNAGCQIVALNYQTKDRHKVRNIAKFQENGSCGYVLKPDFFYSPDSNHLLKAEKIRKTITIRIISGQNLPKIEGDERDIIDPYVVIKIRGHPNDRQQHRTSVIDNNGFNPLWNETMKFKLSLPELALMSFLVKDKDMVSHNDSVGSFTLTVNGLRPGYSTVRLYSEYGVILPLSTLFIHVSIKDEP